MEDFKPDCSKMTYGYGSFITQSLFYELCKAQDKTVAQYSLYEYDREIDGKIYPSLKRLYIECMDVTEYEFALKYFISFKHWRAIRKNKIINRYIDKEKGIDAWKEELALKIRANAISSLCKEAASGHVSAAKYVAEKGWGDIESELYKDVKADEKPEDIADDKVMDSLAKVVDLYGSDEDTGRTG
jgi:hypothetical protein